MKEERVSEKHIGKLMLIQSYSNNSVNKMSDKFKKYCILTELTLIEL